MTGWFRPGADIGLAEEVGIFVVGGDEAKAREDQHEIGSITGANWY